MKHETDLIYDIEAIEYGQRPEAKAETIAELRALMDQMDSQLGPELMDGLRVQVERRSAATKLLRLARRLLCGRRSGFPVV